MTEPTKPAARLTVERLREWVRDAKPGATLEYARGPSSVAAAGEAVCAEVRRLGMHSHSVAGLELIRQNFVRDAKTREGVYIVTRTHKPAPKMLIGGAS